MRGTAFVFGDDVNTDVIMPGSVYSESGRYSGDHEAAARHIFEPIRPGFADELADGDIIVAGENFGSGSGRESAPVTIQAANVGAVVAESFARLFYRNAIAIGLPVVACEGVTELVSEGDTVEVELDEGIVSNLSTGDELASEQFPPEIRSIFEKGGWEGYFETDGSDVRLDEEL